MIVIYRDESVSFGGRLVGGLRVRKPTTDELRVFLRDEGRDDDVPFDIPGEDEPIALEPRATKSSRKPKTKDRAHA